MDAPLCEKLGMSVEMNDCITAVSFAKQDETLCGPIPGTFYEDFCRTLARGNISECDSKKLDQMGLGEAYQTACKAIISKNEGLCETLREQSTFFNLCVGHYDSTVISAQP